MKNLYAYEILDRTHVIMENIQSHICDNPGCTPEMEALALKAHSALFDLYQLAGSASYAETDAPNGDES